MKITVKIEGVEVCIERPFFVDYNSKLKSHNSIVRKNIIEDTVLPTLEKAIEKAKELYKLKIDNQL